MKIKKLEISGFKSFFEKSSIVFPPGISAVVGPNGCGKSNIVDAIRWVMGEQSAKQLRGKSMEDVIFSGSSGSLPLNMAEVSLIIQNDNGSVPEEFKDYAEIMITRRQYRSGERAYFLNKQPCRLKDIHNIFWGSGMGSKSYAVIQQGNIGAITEAGPDERRFFLEEAAGVTRYKNRKNEALRKLNGTKQNLLRINDIIAEVKRQMNGLKRQAKKAERFKKYQDQLREFDVVVSAHYFDDFSRQIEETASLIAELSNADDAHASQLARLDAAIEKIKFEQFQKGQEIAAQKSKKFEIQRTTDKLENDLAHLGKEAETLSDEVQGLDAARVELQKKNQEIGSEVVRAEGDIARMGEEIKNGKSVLETENSSFEEMKNKVMQLNQALEEEKKRLMDLVAEEARYKNTYQNASNNKESLARQLRKIDEEEVIAGRRVVALKKIEKEGKEGLDALREEIGRFNNRIEGAKTKLDKKNQELSGILKHVQTLEFERNKMRSKYTTLVKMEESFEWYKDGVKAIMKRGAGKDSGDLTPSESPTSKGILGIMADFISPKSGFATAVEAVLGESLQYILVRDQEAGIESIDYLQTRGAGRSGFIPASTIKNTRGNPEKIHESADYLLNHVDIKSGYEDIVQVLLGQVLVSNDLHEALSIWKNSNGSGPFTVVSKNGDVVSPQGIMVGGSKDKLSGILIKKNEIKELKVRLKDLDQTIVQEHDKQKEFEAQARGLEVDLQKLIEARNNALRDETEAEKNLYKATEDLKHANRHLEITRLEQEQLSGEKEDMDEEMARFRNALLENEKEIEDAQQKVVETSGKISTASQQQEAVNQQMVDIRLKLSSLNAKFDNSVHTLKRLKEFQDDGVARLSQLSQEIELKNQKKAEAKRRIEACHLKLPEMYEVFKQVETDLETNETSFQIIDTNLQENDNAVSTLQSKREETLEKRRTLELEQSQQRLKQENISDRIEEKYHRSLAAFRPEIEAALNDNEKTLQEMESELTLLKERIARIGDVNIGAIDEYDELKNRFEFLTGQQEDLVKALDDLQKVIRKINQITQARFLKTFNDVNERLAEVFPKLFDGGSAKLVLTEPDNPLETGVEFMVHPPGKKVSSITLLSGGEKALSAIAFLFSIFLLRPASFCLMDEIDAPLDEANIFRFSELLKLIGAKSQVIMITHNKKSMEFADTLFGVTMEKKGISKIVSVNFNQQQ